MRIRVGQVIRFIRRPTNRSGGRGRQKCDFAPPNFATPLLVGSGRCLVIREGYVSGYWAVQLVYSNSHWGVELLGAEFFAMYGVGKRRILGNVPIEFR
jgi:hypothetical protein